MPKIRIDPMTKVGLTSSMDLSKGSISLRLTLMGVHKLIIIIKNNTTQKVINILSKKG